jgi:hypothetical protein
MLEAFCSIPSMGKKRKRQKPYETQIARGQQPSFIKSEREVFGLYSS